MDGSFCFATIDGSRKVAKMSTTLLFSAPRTIADLRDLLNVLALSERAKRFALAIAWAHPRLFGRWAKLKAIRRLEGWTHDDAIAASKELIHMEVLHVTTNGKSVTFSHLEHCRPAVENCVYCGKRCSGPRLTVDHVIPTSRGGQNNAANRVWACRACNEFKADRTPEEVAKMFLDYRKVRKPLTRLPLSYRLRIALAACVAFFAGVVR